MNACKESQSDSKVILVSCSGMCVHGQISAAAVHDVIYNRVQGKCDWICPAAIPAKIDWQINRLKNGRGIIAVPGCPALCDVKALREAGIKPSKIVAAFEVCDFEPWGMELSDIPQHERQAMIDTLAQVIEGEVVSLLHD